MECGLSVLARRNHRTEQSIPVRGHPPIDSLCKCPHAAPSQQPLHDLSAGKPRNQGEEGIKPLQHLPRRLNQKGHGRRARPVLIPQGLGRIFALVGNQPNARPGSSQTGSIQPVLRRDTEPAAPIVDEQAGLLRFHGIGPMRVGHDGGRLPSGRSAAQATIADVPRPGYSAGMTRPWGLLASLIGLIAVGVATLFASQNHGGQPAPGSLWIGFLIGLPIGLVVAVRLGFRWAIMASVIYGTIGLALDLSTIVQLITKDQPTVVMLTTSGFSGLLNFLVIAFGGRAFLDVSLAPPPPGSRPPNPPSPASSATP